ncbi:pentatricopeptide repeat-containing protein At1g07590, mitochondrial [Mercurialis annua]|uniref:pentatricopeptide repeat-containing protein At1g07590, mitochondrial n=1 Tax=Mercurialis annua TaxID=3986 RepID=UPI00215E226E|nr:pentatricopeptide repeat-containing protein At1g07590, mitochondrial [Mercurialis annua]
MLAQVLLGRSRFSQAFHRTLSFTSLFFYQNPHNFSNFLCTQTTHSFPEINKLDPEEEHQHEEKPRSLSLRIEKLSRGEPVGLAFQSWMRDGFPIHHGDIFHAINRLRKLKLNKRALEVMEWVIRERPYRPKELDYSYLLEFTTKLHGISHGEQLFTRVPIEFQNELLYNNLVIACLEKGVIRLSLEYMKKMRELGHSISHLIFNRIIILHSSPGRRKLIPKILAQMKADKVAPHVSTYNILMKIEANDHNIDGLVKVFGDMKRFQVEQNEVSFCILATAHAVARLYTVAEAYVEAVEKSYTGDNWSTLDVLIILYGCLRKGKDLERVWGIVKQLPHVRLKSYILAIEAFGRIGQLDRAEELWSEMKSIKEMKSTDQFNSILSVYCKCGLIKKATAVFREMEVNGCKPNAITFRHLALGCLTAELVEEALKTLEMGIDFRASKKIKSSTPWLETTLSIIEIFAEKGDVANAEKLFEELKKAKYTRYTFVYNTLIKAYVKAKIYVPYLLRRMILGGARPDSETYSLIKLTEQFKT